MSELHHCECVTNRATTKKVNYQDKRLKQKLLPQNDVIMEENILYCLVGSFFFWRFPLTKAKPHSRIQTHILFPLLKENAHINWGRVRSMCDKFTLF